MSIFLFCLSLAPALAYAFLMWRYRRAWDRMPVFEPPAGFVPRTRISVIIPARNEADAIGDCLLSIAAAGYPARLLEILVVDDFSEDDTASVVSRIAAGSAVAIRLLRLADLPAGPRGPVMGKKKAIEYAVRQARGELLVTTDADCLAPAGWLSYFAALYEANAPKAIVGPVLLHGDRGMLAHFQALDMTGMMGITAAGLHLGWHRMGNGANLAYPKSVFGAVEGFTGVDAYASGDDFFLLQKIARHWPAEILFLKNAAAAVRTAAKPSVRSFVQQRLRWGTKNAALPEWRVKAVLAVVFGCCFSLVVAGVVAALWPVWRWVFLAQVILKAAADYYLLRTTACFFGRRDLMRWFWPSFLLHTIYIALLGTASLVVKKYAWKGRMLR